MSTFSLFHSALSQVSHLYYSVASNAWSRAKPIPLCRAGVYSRRFIGRNLLLRRDASIFRFAQCQVCFANIAPAITQIGRENNISAEILLLRTVEDACPYKCCVKLPYEKLRKTTAFISSVKQPAKRFDEREECAYCRKDACKVKELYVRVYFFA